MAKSSKRTKQPAVERKTKKQVAMGRKTARQNRIIWGSVAALSLVVVGVLAAGLVIEMVAKPAAPVAVVNGREVHWAEYEDLLTYRRYNQHQTIRNVESSLRELNPADEGSQFLQSFYEQQLSQLQAQLQVLPQDVLEELIEDRLIEEKAEEAGLAVTAADVEQRIMADLRQAVAPPPQMPITDTAGVPTPTTVPDETLKEIYDNALQGMGLSDKEFRQIVGRGLLRQEVQELLAGQVPTTGLVAHVELIKTDTEEEAALAKARIDQGEDFAIVAREVSTDTLSAADGGDLGWVAPGQLARRYGQEVDDAAFSAEIGALVLVESGGQHYLIRVLERDENGPLPESVIGEKEASALDDWLAERMSDPAVEIERLLEPDKIPPDPFATAPGP